MARDISELGADVYDDSPKKEHRISPKKRNYIIGLTLTGLFLIGAVTASVILCNTTLTDYANVENVMYYFTQDSILQEGEKPYAVLYRLPSDRTFPSTFRIPKKVLGYPVIGVNDHAFSGHKEIKKVIMSNNIKFVGEEAFSNCDNLETFVWSKNLNDVGVDAFKNTAFYNNLLNDKEALYDLPSGLLIYAGENYFDPNTALISDSLTQAEIDSIKANYTVSSVKKFSDLHVNGVCSGAFRNNDKITYIDLPEALDDVPTSTFEGCDNLEGIDGTHSKLTVIGKRAFAGCSKLAEITLPNNLTVLGDEAFEGAGLDDKIPELSHVTSVGESIFANCTHLTTVNYTANKVYKNMFAGCSSLSSLTWGEGNSNIDNVTSIAYGAFRGTAFTNFVIPKNVTEINDYIFEGCESLETVSLYGNPNNVCYEVEMEDNLYQFTDNSGHLFIIEELKDEENLDGSTLTIRDANNSKTQYAFSYSSVANMYFSDLDESDTGLTISITGSGESEVITMTYYDDTNSVFNGTDINLPSEGSISLTRYHYYAYTDRNGDPCDTLIGVSSIKEAAFKGCTSLSTINLYDDSYNVFAGNDNEFTFPYSLTRCDVSSSGALNNYTFQGTIPTKVIFSPNMRHIGSYAFQAIETLTDVVIEYKDRSQLATIKANAFEGCVNLENFDMVPSVIRIEDNAFKRCQSLKALDISGTSITVINAYAFYDCQNIESVTLPSTVSSIKTNAFYRTYKLEYVIVPYAVREILNKAFSECSNDESNPMEIYISRTVSQATTGLGKINFASNWKDDSVQEYFLLGEGEEKETGYNYWRLNEVTGEPEII